jgi:anti-sigma regulatory factor (Ser/Thr protein kinase)
VSSVSTARHTVTDWLRTYSTPDPPLSDIALVISEGVTNAVLHAYVGQPPGTVQVRLDVGDDDVLVTIEDDGHGLRPRTDSPGLGIGLKLMAAVSQRFETHSAGDQGTRVCAWFSRDPAAATLPN